MKYQGYVYVTLNQQTNKVYVGQKFGLPEKSKNYLGSGVALGDSIKKYGKQFFKKRVLGIIEADTKKELKILLDEIETECIFFYRSFGSDGISFDKIYGYNIAPIGGSYLGVKESEETKKKKSISASNKPPKSEERRAKQSKSTKGISRPWAKKPKSEETKKKMSVSAKGENNSQFGKKPPPELVAKREATKKRNRELKKLCLTQIIQLIILLFGINTDGAAK